MNKDLALTVIRNIPGVLGDWYLANERTILPWVSIVSSGAAIGFAVKDSRFILDTIDDGREILSTEQNPETRKAIYKSVLRDITPKIGRIAACYGVAVTATLVNKHHRDKEIAKLTASLGLMTNAVAQYQLWEKEAKKVVEPEKIQEINKAVSDDISKDAPEPTAANTVTAKAPDDAPYANENYLYWDVAGGRYINSKRSPVEIETFCKDSSYDLCDGNVDGDRITYNDIYDFVGGTELEVNGGNDFGWLASMSHGRRQSDIVNVRISPMEKEDHKTLCWQLDICGAPLFRTRY